jgi:hypothetical protein
MALEHAYNNSIPCLSGEPEPPKAMEAPTSSWHSYGEVQAARLSCPHEETRVMLFGRSFRLNTATLGVALVNGHRTFITIHPGSVLKVVSRCPDRPNAMVDVLVGGHIVEMFAIDVRKRSVEVSEANSST